MAAGTRVMRIICRTYQRGVSMTACAVSRSYSHDRGMVRGSCMDRIPGGTVTRRTVAAGREVLADRQARQRTVGGMAGRTGVMGLRISAGQRRRITVTA